MKERIFALVILSLTFLIFRGQARAQGGEEPQYLINSENLQISGFGGPQVSFSIINDEFATFVGGSGAALLNQSFYFGGFGEGLSTMHRIDEDVSCPDKNTISFGYGGLMLGYMHNSHRLIHFNFNAKLGWGGISLYDSDFDVAKFEHCDRDVVFTAIPSVSMQINVLKWMKFNISAGYRFVAGIDNSVYDNNMFNQPSVQMGVIFGNFVSDSEE